MLPILREVEAVENPITAGRTPSVGDWVVYRPYPGGPAEDGEVTEIRDDLVLVRYRGDVTAKATRPGDLQVMTPARASSDEEQA